MEDFELESKSYFFPNRLTLFEQVSQSLSRLISEKKWRPGEMLPNETELAQIPSFIVVFGPNPSLIWV